MDWGFITAVVAAIFSALGIVIGLSIKKFTSNPNTKEIEEKVNSLTGGISSLLESLKEKVSSLKASEVERIKKELLTLEEQVKALRRELELLPVSRESLEALDKISSAIKEIDLSLPSVDNSLLMQIKDNVLIVRNDVENLSVPQVDEKKLEEALRIAKEINLNLVKGELLSLASAIKDEQGAEVLKNLDSSALLSKKLFELLQDVKEELRRK